MFGVAFFFLLLAQHSFGTYPLSLYILSKLKPAKPIAYGQGNLRIAVAMCCHNEVAKLPSKLAEFSQWLAEDTTLHIYLYDDASTDATRPLLTAFASQHKNITLVTGKTRSGKTVGMNSLVENMNNEDLIIFTDPAVTIQGTVLETIQSTFADASIGGLTANLKFINTQESTTAGISGVFSRIQHRGRRLECATGNVLGAGGTFFVIRKSLYVPMPAYIMDDLHTSVHVTTTGARFAYASNLTVQKRAAVKDGEEFNRKQRIACRQINVLKFIAPRLHAGNSFDIYKFHSKYTLRICTGFFLLGFALTSFAAVLGAGYLKIALLLPLFCLLFAAIGYALKVPPILKIINILTMLFAVSLGLKKALFGEKFQTWASAKSIRK